MPDGSLQNQEQSKTMLRPDVALTFSATDAGVRGAMQTIRQALRTRNLEDVCLGTVEIVLAEACNNIVEHAYQYSGKGVVGLTLRYCRGLLIVELTDTGRPMPGLAPPQKKSHDLEAGLQDLPEGGFGWGLIRDMTLSLIYERKGGRNLLRLTIEAQSGE